MSEIKKNTIEAFISNFPEDVRIILQKIRQIIRDEAPQAEECINYGIPTFKLNGNLVHFSAYKNHIGFYPSPSGIREFNDELSEFEHAKGSVKFPLDLDIPYDLIRKIVKFRVKENQKK